MNSCMTVSCEHWLFLTSDIKLRKIVQRIDIVTRVLCKSFIVNFIKSIVIIVLLHQTSNNKIKQA